MGQSSERWHGNYSNVGIHTCVYVVGDLLQRVNVGSLYRDTWPSLFIAPAGLKSELHVDTFASNFWMALLEGKKR